MRTATLYHGHVVDVLARMPERSVQCCVTSPPYWGLRDYKLPPQIWDGVQGCAHEWGGEGRKGGGAHAGGFPGRMANPDRTAVAAASTGSTCCLCGAWRGSLGLEPTVQLYVQHMVQVFRAVWRVLRDDGTVWLNLGDSYANDGKWGGSSGGKHVSELHGETGIGRGKRMTGLKPKDLIGVPWRVALALQDAGW